MDELTILKETSIGKEPREQIRGVKWVLIFFTLATVFIGVYWTFTLRWFGLMEVQGALYLMVVLLLPPVFLILPVKKGIATTSIPVYDIIFSVLSFAIPLHFFLAAHEIFYGGWA